MFNFYVMHTLRASIEEDYAKRMSKLAKQALGRDEIGYVRTSFMLIYGTDTSTESSETL